MNGDGDGVGRRSAVAIYIEVDESSAAMAVRKTMDGCVQMCTRGHACGCEWSGKVVASRTWTCRPGAEGDRGSSRGRRRRRRRRQGVEKY